MSSSLPRIRTIVQFNSNSHIPQTQKQIKHKFKKLNLDIGKESQPEQKKPSLKTLKTQRLKSLERYSTTQEQRQYKNQKIHLNLIQRKLLNGTYDEQKETGNELTTLKQKRDLIQVEMQLKKKQIERIKFLMDDIKKQITGYNNKKQEHENKVNDLQQKCQGQLIKTQSAKQSKCVLDSMIKHRQEINITLSRRYYDLKDNLEKYKTSQSLIETEFRDYSERCSIFETKLQNILKEAVRQRRQREGTIAKQQDKIQKRIEGEVEQKQKSKKYIQLLDDRQKKIQSKEFHKHYDKILANIFITRLCKEKFNQLRQKYQKIEHAYNSISSYRTFDINDPKTFVERYFQHERQMKDRQIEIKTKESIVEKLQSKKTQLLKIYQQIEQQKNANEEKSFEMIKSNHSLKDRLIIETVQKETTEIEQKINQIQKFILRLLRNLNQKGQKKSGPTACFNNLVVLSTILRQSFIKMQ